MSRPIRKIVIAGGGSAGWICASVIAAHTRGGDGIEISLVESPDIPIIGVGEGTWPSMRKTLQGIGLPEASLIRACGASFKQGTLFRGWSGRNGCNDYLHPFSLPTQYADLNPAKVWLAHGARGDFAELVTPQAQVIRKGLAPRQASAPQYAFSVNYGYHFDAAGFAKLLHRHATKNLGVKYISGNIAQIESLPDGDIAALQLSGGERIAGDLFIDCTGHKALLISGLPGSKLRPARDTLFNDRAIAVQVPYGEADAPIAPVTVATAQPAGWIWDIGLSRRRGIGHVHSSAHCEEEDARAELERYIAQSSPGIDPAGLDYRTIDFQPGHRERFWIRNCVAAGLSAGFVEPLEASALVLVEQSAAFIGEQLPRERAIMDVLANRFNEKMRYHWRGIIDFLKLHYAVSERADSEYWRQHRNPQSWPGSLQDKMTLWRQQTPWHEDAPRLDELFPSASYQYVLYGMGYRPPHAPNVGSEAERRRADEVFHDIRQKAADMTRLLPDTRELVKAMADRAAA